MFTKSFPLIFVLGVVSICQAAPPDDFSKQIPHWELIEKHFSAILKATSADDLVDKKADFQHFVLKEKIKGGELAAALLKFSLQDQNPMTQIIYSAVIETHPDTSEMIAVWATALAAEDQSTQSVALSFISLFERSGAAGSSFEMFEPILAKAGNDVPLALIRYMYNKDPGQGVLLIARALGYLSKEKSPRYLELAYAEHMVSHAQWFIANNFKEGREDAVKVAVEQMTKLADAPEWWIRLYVARTVANNKALRTESMTKKLMEDKNQAVRETFNSPVAP